MHDQKIPKEMQEPVAELNEFVNRIVEDRASKAGRLYYLVLASSPLHLRDLRAWISYRFGLIRSDAFRPLSTAAQSMGLAGDIWIGFMEIGDILARAIALDGTFVHPSTSWAAYEDELRSALIDRSGWLIAS